MKNWHKGYTKKIRRTESSMIRSGHQSKGGFKTPPTERLKSIGHKDTTKTLRQM